MTRSVSTNTITSIDCLLTVAHEPQTKRYILLKDIKARILMLNLNSKLIFLRKCISKKVTPNKIMNLAKRTVSELAAKERQYKEENRIINMRINEKLKQITDARNEANATLTQTQKSIQFTSNQWVEYKRVRQHELGNKWEDL